MFRKEPEGLLWVDYESSGSVFRALRRESHVSAECHKGSGELPEMGRRESLSVAAPSSVSDQ